MALSLEAFETAVDAAIAQAAQFEAEAIERAQKAVMDCLKKAKPADLTAQEWAKVATRLAQYRDTCRFLQNTLNQALCKAGRIEGAGYVGRGQRVASTVPLMRRYG